MGDRCEEMCQCNFPQMKEINFAKARKGTERQQHGCSLSLGL